MLNEAVKQLFRRIGLHLARADRLGLEVEIDLARLTERRPLQVIFDVGANFGQTAVRMADAFPQATIYSFEPVPESYQKLKQVTKGLPKVQICDLALGDAQGTASMFIGGHAATNSLVAPAGEGTGGREMTVRVDTVWQFAVANQIERVDLLKIDVEGFELSVLRGAAPMLRDGRIRYVFAECVTRPIAQSPHTILFELQQFLEQFGFCFFNYYPECFDLKSACAMGNVLFARMADLPDSVAGSIANIQ